MNEPCVTDACGARDPLVLGRFRLKGRDGPLQASGVSPLSLLTLRRQRK